jgi:hypothetical protein
LLFDKRRDLAQVRRCKQQGDEYILGRDPADTTPLGVS